MSKKKLVAKSEWGQALHTALRKCCDSKPTSIAYNAICELQTAWVKYLKHVQAEASDGTAESVKKASLSWDYFDVPRQEANIAIILHCAFELFSGVDWDGYVEFLHQ